MQTWLGGREERLGCAANLCHVFWALAVILLAFAGFTVIVVRLRRPVSAADDASEATAQRRSWAAN